MGVGGCLLLGGCETTSSVFGLAKRIETCGRLREACQKGAFGNGQVAKRLVKVSFAGGLAANEKIAE